MRQTPLLCMLLVVLAAPAMAQELSDAEISARFLNQRDAVANNGLPRTLVPMWQEDQPTASAGTEAARNPQDEIHDFPEPLEVNLRVRFAFDSATLLPQEITELDRYCRVMRGLDIDLFQIIGHTDAAGSDAYNERLSLLRAQEVRRYLVESCGISADRLEAVGVGERFPAQPSDPAAADNRRVEFQALS